MPTVGYGLNGQIRTTIVSAEEGIMSTLKPSRRAIIGGLAAVSVAEMVSDKRLGAQPETAPKIDLTNYDLVFEDHFDRFNINPNPATDLVNPTGWIPESNDGANPQWELQRFIDPRNPKMAGHTPFSVENSVLSILADRPPPPIAGEAVNHRRIVSGALTTRGWFRQQYGYFEARLKVPKGASGNWAAFWLLPDSGQWPPEIDILEQIGTKTKTLVTTIHAAPYPDAGKTQVGHSADLPDLAADFHTVGVDWQPEGIAYYFDDRMIWTVRPVNGIAAVDVTNGGTGYVQPPTVSVVGGNGDGAQLRAEVKNGRVVKVVVENSGQNFSAEPSLVFDGQGTGATARAQVGLNDPAVPPDLHVPMYMILNLSLGAAGSWPGATDLDGRDFPRRFEIDYVRVYRRKIAAPVIHDRSDPDAEAIVHRMQVGGLTKQKRQVQAISDLVRQAKAWKLRYDRRPSGAGDPDWDTTALSLWQSLDALYIMAAASPKTAVIDWINPVRSPASVVGQPVFKPLQGYRFSGRIDEFLETGLSLNGASQFRPTDNHLGLWIEDIAPNASRAAAIGTVGTTIVVGSQALDYQLASTSPEKGLARRPLPPGHAVATKSTGNAVALFHNGTIWHTGRVWGRPVVTGSDETIKIGSNRYGIESVSATLSVAHWGRRLMPDESEKLHELLSEYLGALR